MDRIIIESVVAKVETLIGGSLLSGLSDKSQCLVISLRRKYWFEANIIESESESERLDA